MALKGIKVVEMLGLAPGPLCGTILADFGASVTVVQKILQSPFDVMSNGKRMLSVDLKSKEGVYIIRKLCSSSDILLDTFRPGEEWCQVFDNADACVTPVVEMDKVDEHELHASRKTFYRDCENGIVPEPAPRLSATPGVSTGRQPMPQFGQHTVEILKEL
ncbi:hypothetical protein MSG28_003974, partial [Choristoneura fumiferana]